MVDPETKPDELHEIEYISDNYTNGDSEKPGLKTDKNGIALVPQPSNDPRDPLVRDSHLEPVLSNSC
jgi:hypothetical protein